jgi:predicted  nucleic acid-binding Zn-ribbon protein
MSEILSLLKDGDDKIHSLSMNDIEQTQRVIQNFQDVLARQKEKKRKLDSNTDAAKIDKLKKGIKDTKKNIKIANDKLAQQMKQLEKSMNGEEKEEESSASSDGDDSDDSL